MRHGFLGGTFDPIHLGHVDVALAARRALQLDDVTIIPARVPPHRHTPVASAPHRFAMAALAVLGQSGMSVSDIEMLSSDPSYTSDTLERLKWRGVDLGAACLITGADAFREIATWKDYPALLDRCHFAVVSRPGTAVGTLPDLLPDLTDRFAAPDAWENVGRPSIFLIDAPTPPISSTDVRRRIHGGEPVDGLVPVPVAMHIARHGLYR
jgi:nicotinate-nucleotide adenylyltransferase